jgi:cholinesterase
MISDHSKGLFQKAIPMSGSAFCKVWAQVPPLDWPLKLAKHLGYTGKANEKDILEFLEKPDGMAIVQATKKVLTFEEEIGLHILYAFGPVIEPYVSENCFIPKDPVLMAREAWSKNVDMLIGATSNEGILRANSQAEEISRLLQNESFFAPVNELGIDVESDKAKVYGKMLMDVYYKGSKPSAANQQPYLYVRGQVF